MSSDPRPDSTPSLHPFYLAAAPPRADPRGLPRRLQRLDAQRSSGKKKRDELTLEELQAKLQAAEQRRKVRVIPIYACFFVSTSS